MSVDALSKDRRNVTYINANSHAVASRICVAQAPQCGVLSGSNFRMRQGRAPVLAGATATTAWGPPAPPASLPSRPPRRSSDFPTPGHGQLGSAPLLQRACPTKRRLCGCRLRREQARRGPPWKCKAIFMALVACSGPAWRWNLQKPDARRGSRPWKTCTHVGGSPAALAGPAHRLDTFVNPNTTQQHPVLLPACQTLTCTVRLLPLRRGNASETPWQPPQTSPTPLTPMWTSA